MATAKDVRSRVGAGIGLFVMAALALVLVVGVAEDTGDRVVLPLVLIGLAPAVALSRERLRLLAVTAAGGIGAGLVLGAGLRVAMLVAALMGGGVERSLGGTVGLVVFSVVPATVFSGAAALVRRLLPVRPLALAVTTTVLGAGMVLVPAEARAELSARGVLLVNVVLFLGTFALYGYALARVQDRVDRWWDRTNSRIRVSEISRSHPGVMRVP